MTRKLNKYLLWTIVISLTLWLGWLTWQLNNPSTLLDQGFQINNGCLDAVSYPMNAATATADAPKHPLSKCTIQTATAEAATQAAIFKAATAKAADPLFWWLPGH